MENRTSYGQVISLPKHRIQTGNARQAILDRAPLTDMHPSRFADASATGFILSRLAEGKGPILWVQDHASRRENGQIYMPGFKGMGIDRAVLQVAVNHPRDVLWAMEEGAGCAALSAVVGEIHGAPAALDFTATKRLVIRAEASGVPVYLIRSGDPGVLSAARMRWRVAALPSAPHPYDPHAPGAAQWDAELFRARGHVPGRWTVRHEPGATGAADRLCLVSRPDAGAVDPDHQPVPDRAGG